MVVFLVCVIIGVVVGWIIVRKWGRSEREDIFFEGEIMIFGAIIGIILGVGASFWGGSFVKKEIIVEKYVISPMIFNGKPIAVLMEEHDGSVFESDNYIFQIKEGDKIRLIRHCLYKKNIFFTCGDEEERYLEITRLKICKKNMWIWFFYSTGLIESKGVFKKGDSFLTLPGHYSL